ncbi:MAG: glycosyltransferase family 87 protein, partial [Bryobacteraceae bacterium]
PQLALQRKLLPELKEFHPYIRPPLYAFVMAPFALLPLVPAFWIWLCAQVAGLLACWTWACHRFGSDALVYCSFYLPAAYGIMHGQDNAAMLALLIAAFVLAGYETTFTAGAVLGLGLVKFHLLLLFPLVMLAGKRWRMLAGFALAGVVEAVLSLFLVGPEALRQYYDLLRHNDPAAVIRWTMISLPVLPLNFGSNSPLWTAALVAAAVALTLLACWRAPLWRWFSAAAVGSVLISPHAYKYDATMLLLPLLLAIFVSTAKSTRLIAATAVIPIPYLIAVLGPPFAALPAVLFIAFLSALARESYIELRPPKAIPQSLPVAA